MTQKSEYDVSEIDKRKIEMILFLKLYQYVIRVLKLIFHRTAVIFSGTALNSKTALETIRTPKNSSQSPQLESKREDVILNE